MLLFLTFSVGILLVVFGILFLLFPKTLDELSNTMSQVIINVETQITKTRVPVGILLFALGVWILWSTLRAARYV